MKKIFTLCLVFMLTVATHAQWSTNPAINNIISDLSGEQVLPKVGIAPDGSIYIGFFSNISGNYNVRLQKLDSQGNALWAHNGIMISEHPTDSWVTDWDLAVDINNHAILTFADIRAGDLNTVAYRIAPDGTFAWGPNGIALSTTGFNAAPKVTCTAAGNAVFAWSSDNVVIMQKIDPAGNKQWGVNGITLSSTNRITWPQLMPVGTDDVILKYFDDSGLPNAPTRHVYAQRYNASGTAVWSSPTVVSNAGGISAWTQIFPFINDGSDGFYMAWHDDRDNNMMASVFVQHIGSSGQVLYTPNGVEASTSAGFNHFYPYLALPTGSSDVYVFWNEMNSNQSTSGIFGQKFSSSGTRQWGNAGLTVLPLSSTSITPWAASGSATDVVVMYSEGNAATQQLKAFSVDATGSFVWPSQTIHISSVESSKGHIVMSDYAADQWIVGWEDNRSGNVDIYAQNFAIDGSLGPYEILYGTIQGNVTLEGGTGNVTQVIVTTGNNSTLPDPTGDYILQTQVGTYSVTASLAGFYSQTIEEVVVLENQSTNDINFVLQAVPTTGFIEGQVVLLNGTGDVTQTIVSIGMNSTNPDSNGHYILETAVGTFDVQAELNGYSTQILSNIVVLPGETTSNTNFELSLLPETGYLIGTVTIEGNMADVTQAIITAGSITLNPEADGTYLIELPVGETQVTASHPYTNTVNADVIITPGGTTVQNYNLLMLRRDLICKVYQYPGFEPLIGSIVNINGPEGIYEATLEIDSIVFEQVPYGNYSGMAAYFDVYFATSEAIVDHTNNLIEFSIVVESAPTINVKTFLISPNPVASNGNITLIIPQEQSGTLMLYDSYGRKISENSISLTDVSVFPVTLLFDKQKVNEGLYFLKFVSPNDHYTSKLIIKN